MKKFKEFRDECIILEHPNLKARIIAKINPMDKIRDKIDDLKKLPGKIKDTAKEINKFQPDILFSVDSPDFTLRVVKEVKKKMEKKNLLSQRMKKQKQQQKLRQAIKGNLQLKKLRKNKIG